MGAQGAKNVDSGNEWGTPQWVVDHAACQIRRHFTLDVAATDLNRKAPVCYTKEQNALSLPWWGVVWLNPPFSRSLDVCVPGCKRKTCEARGKHLEVPQHGAVDFAKKLVQEAKAGHFEALAWHGPVAPDTDWHGMIWPFVYKRIEYAGRIKYNDGKSGGTFPSSTMLIGPYERDGAEVPTVLVHPPVGNLEADR